MKKQIYIEIKELSDRLNELNIDEYLDKIDGLISLKNPEDISFLYTLIDENEQYDGINECIVVGLDYYNEYDYVNAFVNNVDDLIKKSEMYALVIFYRIINNPKCLKIIIENYDRWPKCMPEIIKIVEKESSEHIDIIKKLKECYVKQS